MRTELRRRRHELEESYRQEADEAIRRRLEELSVYRQAQTVFCYVSAGDEVDTRKLLADMMAAGKCVAVPRCEAVERGTGGTVSGLTAEERGKGGVFAGLITEKRGKAGTDVPAAVGERGRMEAYAITSTDDLEPGAYGILEPKAYCQRVLPEEIDLCVVPCLCVGSGGTRLGYGGGYYDRYLPRLRPDAVCAALCRERLQGEEPPKEPHDRPVDLAVTEKQVIFYEFSK